MMDISAIWNQVLLNACGVRFQQNVPGIIISQESLPLIPVSHNALLYQTHNVKIEDNESESGSEIEDDNQRDINDNCETFDKTEIIETLKEDSLNKDTEQDTEEFNETISKLETDKTKIKGRSKKINRTRFSREEYVCPQCPYRCTTENAFIKHLRFCDSSDKKPFSCPVCGKDRKSEQSLQIHLMKHKLGKQFCCDLCKFKSVQLKKIIQHRRMHTGEKPHLCPHCTYRSSRRDNLRSHVRRVHKEEDLIADTFSPSSMVKSPRRYNSNANMIQPDVVPSKKLI